MNISKSSTEKRHAKIEHTKRKGSALLPLFLTLLLLTTATGTWAQTSVSGTVVDKDGVSLPQVIIRHRDATTKKMLNYGKTDNNGAFSIEVKAGNVLEFTSLGFAKKTVIVNDTSKPLTVILEDAAIQLKDVEVKAERVRLHGDTVTYNLRTFAGKNDRSLGDALARVPGFEVDKSSGAIKYEGKTISKFYIDGIDMLGGKYGVATNNLPQIEVGSVQVMKNHQPIRVLESFTFTDDAAINIRMKDKARTRWIGTFYAGAGLRGSHGLWRAEGFAMRLKNSMQAMLTYKTNNMGRDVSRESTNLFSFETDANKLEQFIQLSPPSASGLSAEHSLFNRAHSATANMMKRLSESSQVNFQLIYDNDRRTAFGTRINEFFLEDGTRRTENIKNYLEKANVLYTLVKYENNARNSYVKNIMSADLKWSDQKLGETGTNPHYQYARLPEYEFKDKVEVIKRYGKRLVSLYSNNIIKSTPQNLNVDSIRQDLSQQMYSTDTYAMGGVRVGSVNLSLKAGLNAMLRRIDTRLEGLPDSLGTLSGKSSFGFTNLYLEPKASFKLSELLMEVVVPIKYIYYKYSSDADGRHSFEPEPSIDIRWNATPMLTLKLNGKISTDIVDFNRFYNTIILQNYQYLNKGFEGYKVPRSKSVRLGLHYNDALLALHSFLSVVRSFATMPYSTSREFKGNYIILSETEQKSHGDNWIVNMMANKGFRPWNTQVRVLGNYMNAKSDIYQNEQRVGFRTQSMNLTCIVSTTPFDGLDVSYNVNYGWNRMSMPAISSGSTVNSWRHTGQLTFPLGIMRIKAQAEYSHNQLPDGSFKDIFFADLELGCKTKVFDYALTLSNLLNKKSYFNTLNTTLTRTTSETKLRGREILLNVHYKL